MPPLDVVLAALAERLDLPAPDRARILDEIAGDLLALRAELIRRGRDPAAAEAEVLDLLAPSAAAAAALVSVHEPLYRSLVRRFSSRLRAAEWVGLVGVTSVALALALGALSRAGVVRSPSAFLAPVLAIGVGIVALAGTGAIRLFVEREHRPDYVRARLHWLLAGAGLAVLCSLAGVVYETAQLARRVEAAPEHQGALVLPWLLDTSVLVASGLTVALVGGLGWFLLHQKVAALEGARGSAGLAASRALGAPVLSLEHTTHTTGVRT